MRRKPSAIGPARIAAVCVTGRPCTQARFNEQRLELIALVVREISRRGWTELDALLFPAGFLRSDAWFGPLHPLDREHELDASDFADALRFAARRLDRRSPGCQIIVGLDSRKPNWGFRGDQLVVAFNALGVTGSARKIFPVDGDTHGWGRAPYLLFEHDPGDERRVIRLANGAEALLSVCYDAFVLSELQIGPTSKRRALRYVSDESDRWRWFERGEADAYLGRLQSLLSRVRPTVHLVSLHGFEAPGRELRWQRHGIASASAALNGALTVGAGHYNHGLPEDIRTHSLAAQHVGEKHLRQGPHRRAHVRPAQDGFHVRLPNSRLQALIRLFIER